MERGATVGPARPFSGRAEGRAPYCRRRGASAGQVVTPSLSGLHVLYPVYMYYTLSKCIIQCLDVLYLSKCIMYRLNVFYPGCAFGRAPHYVGCGACAGPVVTPAFVLYPV